MVTESQAVAAFRDWRSAFLVGGVLCLILGLILLIWPSGTLVVIAALLGASLLLLGISRMANAVVDRSDRGGHRILRGLAGLLYLAAGIIVLANPHATLRTFAVIVGLIWIIGGIVEAVSGVIGGVEGRGRMLIIGLVNVAFGIVLLVWTKPTVLVLVWLIGLWLIAVGLLQLFLAYRAGRAAKSVTAAMA
jgi:uncharacterized membrane protein HdeD (DUF308 family)